MRASAGFCAVACICRPVRVPPRKYCSSATAATATAMITRFCDETAAPPTVKSVVFQVEGQTVTVFGSEGILLEDPSKRADWADELPAMFVDRPAYGAAIGNPGPISGNADVFEAQFRLSILDGAGKVLVDQPVTASCGSGCRGTFQQTVGYTVGKAQWGTLRVYDPSEKDGSPQSVREYPVWLTPRP